MDKITNLRKIDEKKRLKKNSNINQTSFYFEDYLETNKKIQDNMNRYIFKIEFICYFFLFFFSSNFYKDKSYTYIIDEKNIFNLKNKPHIFL